MRVAALSAAAFAGTALAIPMPQGPVVYEAVTEYQTDVQTLVVTANGPPPPTVVAAPSPVVKYETEMQTVVVTAGATASAPTHHTHRHGAKHTQAPAPSSSTHQQPPPAPSTHQQQPTTAAPAPAPATTYAQPATSAAAAAPASSGSNDCSGATDQAYCKRMLPLANKYRAYHPNTNQMQWSSAIEAVLSQHVNSCDSSDFYGKTADGMDFSTNQGTSFMEWNQEAVIMTWYAQIRYFNSNNLWGVQTPELGIGGSQDRGHFAAHVWGTSTHFACARNTCGGSGLTLCGYGGGSVCPNTSPFYAQNIHKPESTSVDDIVAEVCKDAKALVNPNPSLIFKYDFE